MVEFFSLVLIASLIVLAFLLARLWILRSVTGATELLMCCLSGGIWILGYTLEILSPTLPEKILWAKFQYLGIATISVWLLLFIIQYTGHATGFNVRHMLVLLVIPILTILITVTNEAHGWMWTSINLQPGWSAAPLSLGHGGWFWVEISYSYLLLLGSTYLLVQFIFHTQKRYLSQSLTMLVGLLTPWLGNAFYILGIRPGPNLDLTPIAFTLTNIGLVIGFVRFRLLDLRPVAYASIFHVMMDGVVVLDTVGRIVDINPAARRIFGRFNLSPPTRPRPHEPVARDMFIGNRIDKLLPGWEDWTQLIDEYQEKEFRLRPGVGQVDTVYSLRATPLLNKSRQTTGQVLIFTDISERKRAEEQMRLQATALESAENAIVITDPQGRIEWVNPAFTRLTGYTQDEATGQNPRILKSGKHPEEYYENLWSTIVAGKVWHGEMVNRHKNGTLYFEEMTITPLSQPDGVIAHFIAIKQDVSVRKLAEEQLKLAHDQALESNRLKTQLLANVSHDMRTPLGAIIGYAEMLRTDIFGKISRRQKDAISDLQDSANQLLLFVNNLIGQAQFDTGKIQIKPKPFEMQVLIDDCRSLESYSANKKGLRMEYEVDPAMPQTMIGDVYWLRQIVLNLVSNAVKYTDEGSVLVQIFAPDPFHWAIKVADTGIGISVERQAYVFEPFRQVEGLPAHERGGSGLGLAIVKELTALMDGQIELVSQPGLGSTFTVRFPCS